MEFRGGMDGVSEVSEVKGTERKEIPKAVRDKFDHLMGDDWIKEAALERGSQRPALNPTEREEKFNRLFDSGDFFEEPKALGMDKTIQEASRYETDENGQIYKENGELLPNNAYKVHGSIYQTDGLGNIVSCDARPVYTEEGARNKKEQKESGGEERQEDDDGGHIVARILGGSEGMENLVPMRRTVNRGDYKRMENEIAKALQEGKTVSMHTDLTYDDNPGRPSKIRSEYTMDGRKTVCVFDNVENSVVLLDTLEDKISDGDYARLKRMIQEMKEDGCDAAITSARFRYDENGNLAKITVGILDESEGTKSYKEYNPR
ncbi:DNA/RNA non-specific endonuclease [Lachnospiraceae bacterium 29-84]